MTVPVTPTDPAAGRDAAESMSFTVHDAPPPEADLQAATQRRGGRWTMIAILAMCAAPVIASYTMYWLRPHLGTTNWATIIQPLRPMPESLPLRTLDGQPVAAASLRKQWLIVTVAPSTCDAACERRLRVQRQLREMLGAERDRVEKLWLVDDAPGHERPIPDYDRAVYAAAPAMTVLRVDREALARWLAPEAGHQLEDHLYLVDPMGNWMMRAPDEPDEKVLAMKLKKDLERLLRASASWDLPGR